jgi:2-C-methyl-D-erythritol 2,4-cyclodiphosphate synthase
MSKFRVGFGEDIHRLVSGRKLVLCGLTINYEKGLEGHSDADVAYHALSDSLLGALALGDIGKYFPPSDPSITGIDSKLIVLKCFHLVKDAGYELNNVDISIITEGPKLAPYIREMREHVASLLEMDVNDVSVKAMTNEGLDAIGKGEAIKATSLVSLIKHE